MMLQALAADHTLEEADLGGKGLFIHCLMQLFYSLIYRNYLLEAAQRNSVAAVVVEAEVLGGFAGRNLVPEVAQAGR